MTFFETERLCLRNFAPADLDELHDYRSSEICRRYQRGQACGREALCAMIEAHRQDTLAAPGQKRFAVAFKASGQLAGDVFIGIAPPTLSLGYTFSYKHHRQGYAYELLSALTDRLHALYPACELVGCVEPENAASIALLHKLGFASEGYEEKLASLIFSQQASS